MSNPWSAIMPGGVAFTPRPEDDDDDWGFGAPGDPVGEAGDPTPPAPVAETPTNATGAPGGADRPVSTDVDTPTPVVAPPVAPALPAAPMPETPSFAGWADWADDEDDTPAPAPVLLPGQWGTPAAETPTPVTPAVETPVVVTPPSPTVASPAPVTPTPAPVTPAAPAAVPTIQVPPAPAGVTPTAQTPAPSLPVPTAAPAAPTPAAAETPTPAPAPAAAETTKVPAQGPGQWGTPAPVTSVAQAPAPQAPQAPVVVTPPSPVVVEPVVVHEGHRVDTHTGELVPVEMPVADARPEFPSLVPGQWGTPSAETPTPVTPTVPTPSPVASLAPAETPRPSTRTVQPVESVDDLLHAEDDWSDIEEAEKAKDEQAKAEKVKERISRANRPVAVTERDIAILQFLARYRMATYPQIASAFGISYHALRHRMPRLAREGLVVRRAIGKSTYSVWLPTDSGMRVANMDLSLPTLSWATVGHTLGLVDVGIRFEALGEIVVTEREIRAADTRDQPTERMREAGEITGFTQDAARLYVVDMGDGSRQYAHIPDMVLARPPENGGARSVAIELELNHKPAAQWKKILAAYLNAPHIGQVIYFTHQSKVRSGVLAAAKEVGAEHMVRVRKFEPSEENVIPLPGK